MDGRVKPGHDGNASEPRRAATMNEGDVLEIVRSGMCTALIVAGPALAGALLTHRASAGW